MSGGLVGGECRGLVGGLVGPPAATLADWFRRCRVTRLVGDVVGDRSEDWSVHPWHDAGGPAGGDVGGRLFDRSWRCRGLNGGDVGDPVRDWSVHPWVATLADWSAAMGTASRRTGRWRCRGTGRRRRRGFWWDWSVHRVSTLWTGWRRCRIKLPAAGGDVGDWSEDWLTCGDVMDRSAAMSCRPAVTSRWRRRGTGRSDAGDWSRTGRRRRDHRSTCVATL
jgi:hypothetical protein